MFLIGWTSSFGSAEGEGLHRPRSGRL